MFRVVTTVLLGMALTAALPAWAGDSTLEESQDAAVEETQVAPEAASETRVTDPESRDEPRLYRVGARVEGMYRFAHPYGVPPQVLPLFPADLSGLGF